MKIIKMCFFPSLIKMDIVVACSFHIPSIYYIFFKFLRYVNLIIELLLLQLAGFLGEIGKGLEMEGREDGELKVLK